MPSRSAPATSAPAQHTGPALETTPEKGRKCKSKRPKRLTKSQQWTNLVADGKQAIEEAKAAARRAMDVVEALKSMQDEWQEMYDNCSEGAQASPFGQALETITSIDLEPDEDNLSAIEEALDEADNTPVPLGFGRD